MLKSARDYLRNLTRRFIQADVPTTSAALAFHTLLGLVPLIGLIFWYLKKIGITRTWRNEFNQYLMSQLNMSSSESFLKNIDRMSQAISSKSVNYVIFFILLYTVFNLIRRCGDGLDRVFQVESTPMSFRKNFITLSIRRSLAIFVLPLLLVASLAISSWLKQGSWLRPIFNHHTVGPLIARPIPWLIDIFAIFLLFMFVPKKRVAPRDLFKAAVVSGCLFELSKVLMAIYSKNAISIQKIYGALATIPLFIIWIQVSWIIILSGPLFFDLGKKKTKHRVSS